MQASTRNQYHHLFLKQGKQEESNKVREVTNTLQEGALQLPACSDCQAGEQRLEH